VSHRALNPEQFASVIPKGSTFYHVTSKFRLPDIEEKGLHPSEYGESGPGVYVTHSAEYAKKMEGYGPHKHKLQVETTQPLRVLDRTKPGGEEHYRDLQRQDYKGLGRTLTEHGYHGVQYNSFGDPEIAVHDPSHLRVTHWGEP
jgi:hypothetical protein